MSLERDIKKLEKKLNAIAKKEVPKANYSALNKSSARIKTAVVKQVANRTGIKQKTLKKKVFSSKATLKKGFVRMRHYREGVPLISQGARQNRKGVRALKTQFAGAFIATPTIRAKRGNFRGKPQVFKRKGKGRYPLEVLKKSIKNDVDNVFPRVTKVVFAREYEKLLKHEFEWRIKKYLEKQGAK